MEERMWLTEIFRFKDGVYQGSVVVPERWKLLDIDAGGEQLLMANRTPELPLGPHFIVVPLDAVFPGAGEGQR